MCSIGFGASAGTRTRVQALATLGDNHYTTLAGSNQPTKQGYKRLSAKSGARAIQGLLEPESV